MIRICLAVLLMAFPLSALSHDDGHHRTGHKPVQHPCSAAQASSRPAECLPPGKRVPPPAHARAVVTGHVRAGTYQARHVSASHRAAQTAVLAPPPPVRDMSGYRTTVYVAPAGMPYPLAELKPGDYLCTTDTVPLGTKVSGMHSPKPHPPCGYKWAFDSGKDKGYWHLVPDPKYGVRP